MKESPCLFSAGVLLMVVIALVFFPGVALAQQTSDLELPYSAETVGINTCDCPYCNGVGHFHIIFANQHTTDNCKTCNGTGKMQYELLGVLPEEEIFTCFDDSDGRKQPTAVAPAQLSEGTKLMTEDDIRKIVREEVAKALKESLAKPSVAVTQSYSPVASTSYVSYDSGRTWVPEGTAPTFLSGNWSTGSGGCASGSCGTTSTRQGIFGRRR